MLIICLCVLHPVTDEPIQLIAANTATARALAEEHYPRDAKLHLALCVKTRRKICSYTTACMPRQVEGVILEILNDAPRGQAEILISPPSREEQQS